MASSASSRSCSAAWRACASAIAASLSTRAASGPAEVLQVGALGQDVLQLERVEHQTLVGQRVLGLLGDGRGERGPVADDLLDGQPADDRAQRAGEHLAGERVDALLLVQEPLGGGPDRVLGAADLDDRDALQVGADALLADRAAGSRRGSGGWTGRATCSFCTTGSTNTRRAHDDLLAGQVGGAARRRRSATDWPLRPVTMNASLGPATLIRDQDEQDEEEDEQDGAADGDEQDRIMMSFLFYEGGVSSTTTLVELVASITKIRVPSGTGWSARALSFTGCPPREIRTSP